MPLDALAPAGSWRSMPVVKWLQLPDWPSVHWPVGRQLLGANGLLCKPGLSIVMGQQLGLRPCASGKRTSNIWVR